MDFWTFLFGDGSLIMGVAPAVAAAAAPAAGQLFATGVSSVLSFLGSRQARKQADDFRRGARASENKEIDARAEQLVRARAQEDLFANAILNTTGFFRNTSLDDIASGKAVSFRSEPVINAINRSAENQVTTLDRSLAKRGIGDDAVAQTERGEIEQQRGTLIAAEKARAIDQDIKDNFRLTELGLATSGATQEAVTGLADAQRGRTDRLSGLAAQQSKLAGAGGSSAIKGLASFGKLGGFG